jgi:hypothetical protein
MSYPSRYQDHSGDEGLTSLDDGGSMTMVVREVQLDDCSDVEARGANSPDPDFELAVDSLLRGVAETSVPG